MGELYSQCRIVSSPRFDCAGKPHDVFDVPPEASRCHMALRRDCGPGAGSPGRRHAAAAERPWLEVKSPHFTASSPMPARAQAGRWPGSSSRCAPRSRSSGPWAKLATDKPVLVLAARDEADAQGAGPRVLAEGARAASPASPRRARPALPRDAGGHAHDGRRPHDSLLQPLSRLPAGRPRLELRTSAAALAPSGHARAVRQPSGPGQGPLPRADDPRHLDQLREGAAHAPRDACSAADRDVAAFPGWRPAAAVRRPVVGVPALPAVRGPRAHVPRSSTASSAWWHRGRERGRGPSGGLPGSRVACDKGLASLCPHAQASCTGRVDVGRGHRA